MKKLLATLALALAATAPAQAGVGATAAMGSSGNGELGFVAPTLDYRGGGFLVQLGAVDLIGKLPGEVLDLGVSASGVAIKKKIAEEVEGVFMPGGTVRLYSDTGFKNPNMSFGAMARFGAEMKKGMGFGIYVVPTLGASNYAIDPTSGKNEWGVMYGGTLQVSVWFVEKDGGGGDGGGGGGGGGGKKKGKGK